MSTPFDDDFRMAVDHPEDILPTRSLLGKRSPLVLVGAASTAAVLFAGLMSFRSGNSQPLAKDDALSSSRARRDGRGDGRHERRRVRGFRKLDQVWKNITLGGSDDEEDGKK